jgi:LysM repeat protein
LELTVSVDLSVTFNAVGQVITYNYLIRNTGNQSLPGPASVTDDKATTSCREVTTGGNADANLDPTEEVTCTGTHTITQADLDAGSVTNKVTATVGGVTSNTASFPLNLRQNKALTLSKAANPTTYNQVGQVITYTYVILNSGNVTLQGTFAIADDKVTTANCTQPGDGALSPNEEMSCTATYSITQADLAAVSVTNNASASNGTITSANATSTVNKSGAAGTSPVIGGSLQHTVVKGEWLWQIARCYGANPREVINANLQLYHPAKLMPGMVVTVPNVGSIGPVLGPPCIRWHTVAAGDTWASIAQLYNADVNFIQKVEVNPRGLVTGAEVRVPVGPYQYPP